jgi:proline dehydrogenase
LEELVKIGASALRMAALDESAKEYILHDQVLFSMLKRAANRYIAGETLVEAIVKVDEENQNGFKCSLEFIGESTRTEHEAAEATEEFLNIARMIGSRGLHSTVSLDLSHIGLVISQELCLHHLDLICTEAGRSGTEVIISAEGTERTEAILETYSQISKRHENVSITLQAYLHRTKDDFQNVIQNNGRIRIVKGAFETAKGHSLPRGSQLNKAYLSYIDQLLSHKHACSIATHDPYIQQECRKMVDLYQPESSLYEFESLYGVQSGQLAKLKVDGYATKLYLVYGREWYLYLCNRIAEYPLNLFLALQDIVGGEE